MTDDKEVVYGTVPSKSNSYRIGKKHLYTTDKLKDYEQAFVLQCKKYRNAAIESEFKLKVDVYFPSKRSDLDNSLKIILDCLQKAGAIKNDNKCVDIEARRFVSKEYPRVEFVITELN